MMTIAPFMVEDLLEGWARIEAIRKIHDEANRNGRAVQYKTENGLRGCFCETCVEIRVPRKE